ncbi:MAG: AAA family ATPase [Bacteroidota bacterium]|nr:AAA family ATPase [Bacteroidota bacterium]
MINKFEDIFLKNLSFVPTDNQMQLLGYLEEFLFLEKNKVFILKGYAGTGKTTMMSALIKTLPFFHLYSVLLAPTGRAAKVLAKYSQKKAYTIHKRIYFSHHEDNSFTFKLKTNRSKHTIFIVDESSMIGTDNSGAFRRNLLDDLMEYIFSQDSCKVIFIGDTAQLPPVGQNLSFALDEDYLTNRYRLPCISFQLSQVVRQALESGILKNASNLRFRIFKENYSLPIFKTLDLSDIKSISASDFEEYLRQAYKQDGTQEVLVIAKSNYQANKLNNLIRYQILERENLLEAGDRLMVVKNNYFWIDENDELGFIANGDIFRINRVLSIEERFGFQFADVSICFDDYENIPVLEVKILLNTLSLEQASLAKEEERTLYNNIFQHHYKETNNKAQAQKNTFNDPYFNALQVKFATCLTCHKSQGGGWNTVFVFQSYLTLENINKEYFRWLYTAITRAKKQLYLVNFSEDFFKN